MDQIHAEIEAIHAQIEVLRQERASLKVESVAPENDSPQAIVEAYRRHARETSHISAEVKGIDDAIAALEAQLHQKQAELDLSPMQRQQYTLQQQVEAGRQQAQVHAERINKLAVELAEEVRALKAIADDLSPSYWRLHDKPFINGFGKISVPQVRYDTAVWTIANRVV